VDKKFKLTTTGRSPLPRSKRLKELGTGAGQTRSGSTVVSITNAADGGSAATSHTHENKASLDKLSVEDSYLYIDQEVEVTDTDTGETDTVTEAKKANVGYADTAGNADYATEAGHSIEADHAKEADEADDFTETLWEQLKTLFLSRLGDDTASGLITFLKGLVAEDAIKANGGLTIGDFMASLYTGRGAAIDSKGNAEFESVGVRSAMNVLELIVNRWTALEGDFPLTESDTIESVDDLGDGTYGLHLRSKWDGYFTGQKVNNVIKGIMNTLAEGSGDYYTSFMRVNSVNTAGNYIEVSLYPDDEVPAGKNYPPSELMRIARWGNQTDESLQSLIYLSSTDGRIVKLTGVTKPILEDYNYGATFGTLPEFVQSTPGVLKGRDYLYAQGIVVQDRIKVDYNGKPVTEYVDRGTWVQGESYYCSEYNENYGGIETSDVWLYGCKWRCQKTGTTVAPAWNSTDWAMIEGNPDFTIDFEEQPQIYDIDNFQLTLTMIATLYNQDVTAAILTNDIEWTRYSEDADGNPRTASDNLWAINHAGIGKQLNATIKDLDVDSSGFPKTIVFTCTATLRDGADTLTNSVTMQMI
jgi:hypothetical protein